MNSSKLPDIRGEVIKKAREAKGISIAEMSKELCFSVKQIEQIECGERSHFYSLAIKVAATKRVADYLGLSAEEVFDFGPDLVQSAQSSNETADPIQVKAEDPKPIEVSLPPPIAEKLPERLERFELPSDVVETKSSKAKFFFLALVAIAAIAIFSFEPSGGDRAKEAPMAKLPTESIDSAANEATKKDEAPVAGSVTPSNLVPSSVGSPSSIAGSTENCPPQDANPTTYRSPSPSKAGNMVYVSSRIKQVVCVRDATGKLEKRPLEANGSHSFFGKAPFVLMTSGLAQADIFFQGYKVRIDDPNANSVILEEIPY